MYTCAVNVRYSAAHVILRFDAHFMGHLPLRPCRVMGITYFIYYVKKRRSYLRSWLYRRGITDVERKSWQYLQYPQVLNQFVISYILIKTFKIENSMLIMQDSLCVRECIAIAILLLNQIISNMLNIEEPSPCNSSR